MFNFHYQLAWLQKHLGNNDSYVFEGASMAV